MSPMQPGCTARLCKEQHCSERGWVGGFVTMLGPGPLLLMASTCGSAEGSQEPLPSDPGLPAPSFPVPLDTHEGRGGVAVTKPGSQVTMRQGSK